LPVRPFMRAGARWNAMIRYLEERAPCIYVPNYDFGHSCISPRLSARVGIVGIAHSDDPQHYEHVARLGKYWNAVVAVSSTIADEILKTAPELAPRLRVIPYGVPVPDRFPERAGPPDVPLRIIYAGRLDQKQKRVLDLPEILQGARNLGASIQLTIAGAGSAETQLRTKCAALGVAGQVEFVGTLDREALARVLARQHVFVLPSEFEGLPIGVLEAMGSGCIPVVTDIRSGVREAIQDGSNGFLVARGDIAGFAKRLADLYDDAGMRRRMAEAAYHTVRSGRYRLDSMVESYAGLFERVFRDMQDGSFRRPAGSIHRPPGVPWPEYLPESLQRAGNFGRRLLTKARA
jgi:glycosyltransferase involved in cell wall biosynthesis